MAEKQLVERSSADKAVELHQVLSSRGVQLSIGIPSIKTRNEFIALSVLNNGLYYELAAESLFANILSREKIILTNGERANKGLMYLEFMLSRHMVERTTLYERAWFIDNVLCKLGKSFLLDTMIRSYDDRVISHFKLMKVPGKTHAVFEQCILESVYCHNRRTTPRPLYLEIIAYALIGNCSSFIPGILRAVGMSTAEDIPGELREVLINRVFNDNYHEHSNVSNPLSVQWLIRAVDFTMRLASVGSQDTLWSSLFRATAGMDAVSADKIVKQYPALQTLREQCYASDGSYATHIGGMHGIRKIAELEAFLARHTDKLTNHHLIDMLLPDTKEFAIKLLNAVPDPKAKPGTEYTDQREYIVEAYFRTARQHVFEEGAYDVLKTSKLPPWQIVRAADNAYIFIESWFLECIDRVVEPYFACSGQTVKDLARDGLRRDIGEVPEERKLAVKRMEAKLSQMK